MGKKITLLQLISGRIKNLLFLFLLFLIFQISCKSQNLNKIDFESFVNKFCIVDLPICNSKFKETERISENEFDLYLGLDTSFWKYQECFYYYSGIRFDLDKENIALIYRRIYEPEESFLGKREYVLSTFKKNGEFISFVILDGINQLIDEEIVIDGKINSKLEVSITISHFTIDLQGKENCSIISRKFKIDSITGEIR